MTIIAWIRANCRFATYQFVGGKCWVSPNGEFFPVSSSHPDWAQHNYKQYGIDFHPTQTLDYEETTDPNEAWMDSEEQIALDKFKEAGWLRVDPSGIEGYVSPRNLNLIKRILRDLAKQRAGSSLYIDGGDGTINVPVSYTGRPDFSALDAAAMRYA